jgi:sec-independent protein translocase protein TatB
VFNLSGSEIVVILLLALIVLGPEKLPEAIRRFGRVYSEIRKISNGFQSEFKNAFDEPMRELRETAQLTRDAVLKPLQDEPEVKKPEVKKPETIASDSEVPAVTEVVPPPDADGGNS